jgi:hypothetical protein
MATNPFPTRSDAQAMGERGVSLVSMTVLDALRWAFRRTPQEADFGVDAYIDIVTNGGYVTGKSLAVQIKTGRSYLVESGSDAWLYRGNLKHVNYYLSLSVPVILLLVDPESRQIWWRHFQAYETDGTQEGWTIRVPKINRFDENARPQLELLAGPVTDYLPHLQEHWMLGDQVRDVALVCVQVVRLEIESHDVRPFARLFERLSRTRDTVLSARHKVDFLIDGYNDDPRDLFEIPEIRRWVETAVQTVTCLPYFLSFAASAQGIVTILNCLCAAERVDSKFVRLTSPSPRPLLDFMDAQFAGLNEFTGKFALGEQVNREVSEAFSSKIQAMFRGSDA